MNIPKSKTKWQKTQPEIMFKKIKILAKIKIRTFLLKIIMQSIVIFQKGIEIKSLQKLLKLFRMSKLMNT
jgi:hypothetical protein